MFSYIRYNVSYADEHEIYILDLHVFQLRFPQNYAAQRLRVKNTELYTRKYVGHRRLIFLRHDHDTVQCLHSKDILSATSHLYIYQPPSQT